MHDDTYSFGRVSIMIWTKQSNTMWPKFLISLLLTLLSKLAQYTVPLLCRASQTHTHDPGPTTLTEKSLEGVY